MKAPAELSAKLQRQWCNADLRESRLLHDFDWPIRLPIGKPTATDIKNSSAQLRQHIQDWRKQKTMVVEWQPVKYQSASSAVDVPACWCIRSVEEWVAACKDKEISREYDFLCEILPQVEKPFHSLLVRHRKLWHSKSSQQIVQCCQLAMQLQPGCAQGRPLRALSLANIDSKFIEKHRSLLIKLLNIRFNNALDKTLLETFLGAVHDNDHWLLVIPLAQGLLPFKQLRIKASELATTPLPASHIVVVENEQCQYQLPELADTIAILGSGLNLNWLNNLNFNTSKIAYWGDMDTWGLKMLAMATKQQPAITPILMDSETFNKNQQHAVAEPQHAGNEVPPGLNHNQAELYQKLIQLPKGRLEQEFLDKNDVYNVLVNWHKAIAIQSSKLG